jgi:SSS family solute:Na+ symporter/sodium/proline symporter
MGIVLLYGRSRDNEDYLIADRNLGFWSGAMTIISSKVGAGFLISVMAFVYLWGVIALFAFIGILIGYLLFIPFAKYLKKEADKNKFYTLPEFYRYKYGFKAGILMAILMFAVMLISVVTQLIGGAHIIADTSGVSYTMGVFIIAAIVLFYLLLGGFRSVVATDFLQGICLLGLVPIFLAVTLISIGDLSIIDFTLTREGIKNVPNFVIIGIVLPFATPELWQRVYAIKSVKMVGRTLIGTAILYSLFGLLVTIMGLYFTNIVGDIVPETLLISGFEKVLPAGLATFGIVFLLSAIMSSFDTYVFTASTILVQDFISPKGREHKGKSAVLNLRLWQISLIVISIIYAILLPSIIDTTLIVVGMYAIAGVVGIAAAIRKGKLTSPWLAILLGLIGGIYTIIFYGVTTHLIAIGAVGALLGLCLGGIYSFTKKSKSSE